MRKQRVFVWLVLLGTMTVSLAACGAQPVPQPARSPIQGLSPLQRPSPIQSPVAPRVVNRTNKPQVSMDVDLNPVVLTPADMADLFKATTYALQQSVSNADMRGLVLTYPTQSIEHTTAFAEGFSTRIEVHKDATKAAQAYEAAGAQQPGEPVEIGELGDASHAWVGKALTPEGQELPKSEYVVLVRQQNALVILTLRTDKKVAAARLSSLAGVVLGRLSP